MDTQYRTLKAFVCRLPIRRCEQSARGLLECIFLQKALFAKSTTIFEKIPD